MSKHWRMLTGATLAAINPAGRTTVVFAQPAAHDAINQALAQHPAPTPDEGWRRWSYRRQPHQPPHRK
jgi:hypothetical protein